MNTSRYEPWFLVNRLSHDIDRLLNPSAFGDQHSQSVVEWVPTVDVREQEKQFVIHADLPGVDPKNIDVTLEKGVLTIRGRRDLEARDEKRGFRHVERISGDFYRRFTLPDTADSPSVSAKVANGVLEVTIPKQAQVLPRRIDVQGA